MTFECHNLLKKNLIPKFPYAQTRCCADRCPRHRRLLPTNRKNRPAKRPVQLLVTARAHACHDHLIERDGSILVRAPRWASDKQIEDVVQTKQYWIYRALAEWRDLNATKVIREFKNGEGFLYLGRSYRLRAWSMIRKTLCS